MARMPRAGVVAILVAGLSVVAAMPASASLGPAGAELRVHDPSANFEGKPDVTAQGDGYVVAWYDSLPGSDRNIYARRYGPDDTPRGDIVPVSTDGANEEIPRIDAAPDGTFVVAWETDSDQSAVRRFAADGTPLTGIAASASSPERPCASNNKGAMRNSISTAPSAAQSSTASKATCSQASGEAIAATVSPKAAT